MLSIGHGFAIFFLGWFIYGQVCRLLWCDSEPETPASVSTDALPVFPSRFGSPSEGDLKRCHPNNARWHVIKALYETAYVGSHDKETVYCIQFYFPALRAFFIENNPILHASADDAEQDDFKKARIFMKEEELRTRYCTDDKIMERFGSIRQYAAEEGWITGSPQSWTQDTKEIKDKSKQEDIHHIFFCITEEDERHPRTITTGRGRLSHYYSFSTTSTSLKIYATDFHHWLHQTFIFTNII